MNKSFASPQGPRPELEECAIQPVCGAFQPTLESMAQSNR